ncbi:MAG: hypothetical protein Q8M20_12105 [Rhodocyclaceae bacterium]|nr:hypothetical protein [Rhodocyclaceae bacterium]MDZ4213545.1 hypothetical protein [Rhodocyclaceae bacterium]
MIFQPAIIALLLAAGLSLAMLLIASPFAVQVIRHWDIASGSERQLRLERLTYLFSTLVAFVCLIQILSALLFVFNADKMSVMFVGAMCAVGALNVNEFGFPALYLQLGLFFLAALWLAINHADSQARDYPLVKLKYTLLLAAIPLFALSLGLQLEYFLGLKADVITSCCGSLFSSDAPTLASEVSALEPKPAMLMFYGTLIAAITLAGWHWQRRDNLSGYAAGLGALAAFVASIAGILAFISLYLYEHPNHHCPFCILKPEYDYQGYWLYLPLFAAAAAGMSAGVLRIFSGRPSLANVVPALTGRLAGIAAIGNVLFALIASVMIWRSNLILLE